MFIPNYPNFTVVEFDGLVYEEIKLNGDQIDNLFIEDLQLKYLPDDLFLFIPNLKWVDLRYVWRMLGLLSVAFCFGKKLKENNDGISHHFYIYI